jgi:hypothetical protein
MDKRPFSIGSKVLVLSKSVGGKLEDSVSKSLKNRGVDLRKDAQISDIYLVGTSSHRRIIQVPSFHGAKDEDIYVIQGDFFLSRDLAYPGTVNNSALLDQLTEK